MDWTGICLHVDIPSIIWMSLYRGTWVSVVLSSLLFDSAWWIRMKFVRGESTAFLRQRSLWLGVLHVACESLEFNGTGGELKKFSDNHSTTHRKTGAIGSKKEPGSSSRRSMSRLKTIVELEMSLLGRKFRFLFQTVSLRKTICSCCVEFVIADWFFFRIKWNQVWSIRAKRPRTISASDEATFLTHLCSKCDVLIRSCPLEGKVFARISGDCGLAWLLHATRDLSCVFMSSSMSFTLSPVLVPGFPCAFELHTERWSVCAFSGLATWRAKMLFFWDNFLSNESQFWWKLFRNYGSSSLLLQLVFPTQARTFVPLETTRAMETFISNAPKKFVPTSCSIWRFFYPFEKKAVLRKKERYFANLKWTSVVSQRPDGLRPRSCRTLIAIFKANGRQNCRV